MNSNRVRWNILNSAPANVLKGAVLGVAAMLLISDAQFVTLTVSHVDVATEIVDDAAVPEEGYPSELAAVTAASNRFNPDSVAFNREHVGGIVRCEGGRYFYTHGVGAEGQAPVQFAIAIPAGCTLTSLWHTHGGAHRHRQYFSASDTESADTIGKPMFMANHLGELRVYQPDARRTRSAMGGSIVRLRRGVTPGELITTDVGHLVRIATR